MRKILNVLVAKVNEINIEDLILLDKSTSILYVHDGFTIWDELHLF